MYVHLQIFCMKKFTPQKFSAVRLLKMCCLDSDALYAVKAACECGCTYVRTYICMYCTVSACLYIIMYVGST